MYEGLKAAISDLSSKVPQSSLRGYILDPPGGTLQQFEKLRVIGPGMCFYEPLEGLPHKPGCIGHIVDLSEGGESGARPM